MKMPVLNDPLFIADHEYIVTVAEIHIAEKSARHERKRRDRKFHAENMPEVRKNREWNREVAVFEKCIHYAGLWHGNPIRQEREINAGNIRMKDFSAEIYGGEFLTFAESMAEKIHHEEELCWALFEAEEELNNAILSMPENYDWCDYEDEVFPYEDQLCSAMRKIRMEERW